MKTYEPAPEEVRERAGILIEKFHADLFSTQAKIDYVFARNDGGDAIKHHGYPALAVVRILSLKDRSMGRGDAEVTIDAENYLSMDDDQRDALLDHELHHLIVCRDNENAVKTDDLNRPVFQMRKHDWQLGFFTVIAQRHKMASPEVTQATRMMLRDGQYYWPQLAGKIIDVEDATLVSLKKGRKAA